MSVYGKQEGWNSEFPRTMKGGGSVRPLLPLSGAGCTLPPPPPIINQFLITG
jgi:hypothetical protein